MLLVLALLPGLTLRLHHYIVALMLLPLTGFLTRLSAIYQAFLLGLLMSHGKQFTLYNHKTGPNGWYVCSRHPPTLRPPRNQPNP